MNSHLATLLNELAPEEGRKLLHDSGTAALETVLVALIEALPEKRVEEFHTIVTRGNEEELEAFFKDALPDADKIVTREIERLQTELSAIDSLA